ncbi:ABC transporter permease [Mesorhizobium sp. M7A.F.Ca.US.006.01.1.1]|uniref:ABC transporter permease n=1 Tax=Mesorhizobium sp. M7A.F.Ca.US.006.01.1.1 TaxID=2496707 RepID=UPI000FCAA8CA|nr:ABC transporter permease [Mesorhizobium sp. M7A.F.Ca.US.006.01.1.1]RUZ77856.1 ABC transporter permease [Mesorhizobium sp. M7A.F.Ca.US.006.01.1.1]
MTALSPKAASLRLPTFVTAGGLLPIFLLSLVVMLSVVEPRFFSDANLSNVLRNTSYLALISAGQMLVMILGGIDLSVGVIVALSSVTTSIVMSRLDTLLPGQGAAVITLACLAGLGLSAAIGAINGILVAYTKASAFMITLGTLSVAGGIAFYVTSGIPIYGMPDAFTKGFGRGSWFGFSYPTYLALALILLIALAQRHFNVGRHLYAIGGHGPAARSSGISVKALTIGAYTCCSLLSGLAGIVITARIGSGQANLGSEFMLQSIGAAVLAGVSLRGGIGRAEMIALSSLLLTVVANGMNLLKIDSKLQTIVFGVLLLIAILTDRRSRRGVEHG